MLLDPIIQKSMSSIFAVLKVSISVYFEIKTNELHCITIIEKIIDRNLETFYVHKIYPTISNLPTKVFFYIFVVKIKALFYGLSFTLEWILLSAQYVAKALQSFEHT